MRRALIAVAIITTTALTGTVTATAHPAKAKYGLTVVSERSVSPRTVDLEFRTAALVGTTPVTLLLPVGYGSSQRRYPVLYLLDGCCNASNTWINEEDIDALTKHLPLIVVMAAQGEAGFFTNWYNGGRFGPPQWATYYIDQLLPWVDAHFRTTGAKRGRALAGMSMGGFGAMSLAAQHPDLFAAAASFSGLVNLNDLGGWALADALTLLDGGLPGDIFGPHTTQAIREIGTNPWNLAANLRGLTLVIRTGNGLPGGPLGYGTGIPGLDPIEANVAEESREFHDRLDALGIRNVYDDYGPGNHSAPYWQRDLAQTLPELMAAFAHPPTRPRSVTFTSIRSTYSVFGWSVQMHRNALEFSTLEHADRGGFALSGSGSAAVTTPAVYRGGSSHRVTITSLRGTVGETVQASDSGRLRIPLVLGPANPYQADTAAALTVGSHTDTSTVRIG
jgi:S-formylglutathione hydrolase FrmB